MEASAFALERLARASQEPMAGKVTLSAPPVLVTHLLARRLADFRRAHPAIQLSVSAQAQQVSLNRREADVALRLVRPRESSYLVRKLGQMPFALYASSDYAPCGSPTTGPSSHTTLSFPTCRNSAGCWTSPASGPSAAS